MAAKSVSGLLSPLTFLQSFLAHSVRAACLPSDEGRGDDARRYVEEIGLTAAPSLEEEARRVLGYHGPMDPDQYAHVLVTLKNRIGGNFSRASSEGGRIRLVNTVCPFGDVVREVPALCRMTSAVFGHIAARNFGYGKVHLARRLAIGDPYCEVSVWTDPEQARGHPGDEYGARGDRVVSEPAWSDARIQVQENLRRVWACSGDRPCGCESVPDLIAESAAMGEVVRAIGVVAATDVSVLITGETGVGKEVVARAIHASSPRSRGPFLAVNCSTIPETLVESILFGHEKGAFTNAYNVHHGLFERAGGGTLFLDEIDTVPLAVQARLLRVLQNGEFERVGGKQVLHSDVRVLAACNQPLEQAVEEGRFRKDLYFRIHVVPIRIPPLRERPEDIETFVPVYLSRLARRYGGRPKRLGAEAWRQVMHHHWPGNFRELENVLERAVLFAGDAPVIQTLDLPVAEAAESPAARDLAEVRRRATEEAERRVMCEALGRHAGNVSAVAREFGLSRRAIHLRLRRLGLDAGRFRRRKRADLL